MIKPIEPQTNWFGNIKMEQVGEWNLTPGGYYPLARYWKGSDGNYWVSQDQWRCIGKKIRNMRGTTLTGEDIDSLPELP
jgi:hypothetical protein